MLADGKKEVSDKTNAKDGFIPKPSGGSSSQPVTNCKSFRNWPFPFFHLKIRPLASKSLKIIPF